MCVQYALANLATYRQCSTTTVAVHVLLYLYHPSTLPVPCLLVRYQVGLMNVSCPLSQTYLHNTCTELRFGNTALPHHEW